MGEPVLPCSLCSSSTALGLRGPPGAVEGASSVPSELPSPPDLPTPPGSTPEKAKVASTLPWVTCFLETAVLPFRGRLHWHAQVPVGARHCGLGRRRGSATMGSGDGRTESRRRAEDGSSRRTPGGREEPEGGLAQATPQGGASVSSPACSPRSTTRTRPLPSRPAPPPATGPPTPSCPGPPPSGDRSAGRSRGSRSGSPGGGSASPPGGRASPGEPGRGRRSLGPPSSVPCCGDRRVRRLPRSPLASGDSRPERPPAPTPALSASFSPPAAPAEAPPPLACLRPPSRIPALLSVRSQATPVHKGDSAPTGATDKRRRGT